MYMPLFSSRKSSSKIVAIFHIGSGHVSGSIVRTTGAGDAPVLLVTREQAIALDMDMSYAKFLAHMEKALGHVASQLAHSGMPAPTEVHCFLGAPWYTSVSRKVTLEKKAPFAFTKALADELVAKEITKTTTEIIRTYPFHEDSLTIIEQTVLGTTLNGYVQHEPYGKKTLSASISLFLSFTPASVMQVLQRGVAKGYPHATIRCHSFMVAGGMVSRALFTTMPDFVCLDVGRELCDISIVKGGTIVATASFPLGFRFILSRIMSSQRCDHDTALRLFQLANDGMLDDATAAGVTKTLSLATIDWQRALSETLLASTESFSVPETVVLTADTQFMAFFKKAIESDDFHFAQLSKKKLGVVPLDRSALLPYVKSEAGAQLHHFSMIESVFINAYK